VTLILTLAIFPSYSWTFMQQVWYSNGWQTVIVEFNTNISESMFGKFPSPRPVFIPGMCTVPWNQSIKCQVHCLEMSHMWSLRSVEYQLADRLRSGRLWTWESVHGGTHYNLWHPPAELFHTINQKTQIWIFRIGCYAWVHKLSCLLFKTVCFIAGKVKAVLGMLWRLTGERRYSSTH